MGNLDLAAKRRLFESVNFRQLEYKGNTSVRSAPPGYANKPNTSAGK